MTRSSGSATEFWQAFAPADAATDRPGPWQDSVPARMPDGSSLTLPLRDLGDTAVAGLIVNQASFRVFDRLVEWMVQRARNFAADIVVGLPTLGHPLGAAVARALGHAHWVAPGTSQKIWYEARLSVPLASITAPAAGRRMWLDPRLLPRLAGRRVLLVDDVISTGASAQAGLALLDAAGIVPVGLCVAMVQGDRWQAAWSGAIPVAAAFATPIYRRQPDGWWADEATRATVHVASGS